MSEQRGSAASPASAPVSRLPERQESQKGLFGPGRYPLVGRSDEWKRLLEAYSASGPDGRIAVIEGEAGIGKTRLAESFVECARTAGASVMEARYFEGETNLAYGAFIDGLRRALSQPGAAHRLAGLPPHWLAEAVRVLPELGNRSAGQPDFLPPLDSPGAQSRFFEGLIQVLLALLAGDLPGVLLVDDLHWADNASLDLLAYLVRRLRGKPLFVLVTWRAEGVPAGHRLRQLQAEAQRADTLTSLHLGRLDRADVLALVQAAVHAGMKAPPELAEQLYRETEGLPFFLVEYLEALRKEHAANAMDTRSLPTGVRDLLHSRLATVGETGWQILTTAAVIGRSFDFDSIRLASGRSDEEVIAALEALVAQGLIRETQESSPAYDFTHEKLRSLVYEETSLARRRLLHRRIAEAIASGGRSLREAGEVRPDIGARAALVAFHYRQAGLDSLAATYYRQAGEHARSLYANAEALSHFRTALALGHADAAALHEAIGDLETLLGNYSTAVNNYETAAALGQPRHLARVEHKLGRVHHRRGEWDLAELHYQAALAAYGEEGWAAERAGVYADLSLTAHRRGSLDQAVGFAQQALALAQAVDDRTALAQVYNILGVLARNQGRVVDACRYLEQSLAIAEAQGDALARIAALNNLALTWGDRQDPARGIEFARQALITCQALGDRHWEAALHNNLADLYRAAGQSEPAMMHLKQAVAIYADIGVEAGTVQTEIWKLAEW